MQQWNNSQKITKPLWKSFYSIGMIVYFYGGWWCWKSCCVLEWLINSSVSCFLMVLLNFTLILMKLPVSQTIWLWMQIKLAYGKQCKHTSHFSTCESTEVLWYTFLRFSTRFSVSLYFQILFFLLWATSLPDLKIKN